jgi:hypothetical protein
MENDLAELDGTRLAKPVSGHRVKLYYVREGNLRSSSRRISDLGVNVSNIPRLSLAQSFDLKMTLMTMLFANKRAARRLRFLRGNKPFLKVTFTQQYS